MAIIILAILIAILSTSAEGSTCNKLPLTVIPGSDGTAACPSKESLERSRQTISEMITDMLNTSIYTDCKGALDHGQRITGLYKVQPDDFEPFDVYCDMETDGGGWTVFQRRQDGSEDFYRGWDDYVMGFGNLCGEFWLGLEKIHRLTKRIPTGLRIDMGDFEGNTSFAKYDTFRVLSSSNNYTLNVAGYSGTAGDSLTYHNGQAFTTKYQDNDHSGENCAVTFKGAWWYAACHSSNLNGLYHNGSHTSYADGVNWYAWKGHHYSLKFTEMKLR